jgi:enoyl-CoA hydratase/carnithine racemase
MRSALQQGAMITLSQRGDIATLTLDRPATRNAFRIADWHALADAVAGVEARAIILRSTVPGSFAAGADIAEMAALADVEAARIAFREAMRCAIDGIAAAPAPVIALIEGGCYGAAVGLAAACDIRVAGPGARFAITPARLGIGYPAEDVARIGGLIGRGQASRLLLTAGTIDAAEAARIGLVDILADDAASEAQSLADAIAANASGAVALLRATLRGESGAADFDAAFGGAEFPEGLAAFREKRRPRFA